MRIPADFKVHFQHYRPLVVWLTFMLHWTAPSATESSEWEQSTEWRTATTLNGEPTQIKYRYSQRRTRKNGSNTAEYGMKIKNDWNQSIRFEWSVAFDRSQMGYTVTGSTEGGRMTLHPYKEKPWLGFFGTADQDLRMVIRTPNPGLMLSAPQSDFQIGEKERLAVQKQLDDLSVENTLDPIQSKQFSRAMADIADTPAAERVKKKISDAIDRMSGKIEKDAEAIYTETSDESVQSSKGLAEWRRKDHENADKQQKAMYAELRKQKREREPQIEEERRGHKKADERLASKRIHVPTPRQMGELTLELNSATDEAYGYSMNTDGTLRDSPNEIVGRWQINGRTLTYNVAYSFISFDEKRRYTAEFTGTLKSELDDDDGDHRRIYEGKSQIYDGHSSQPFVYEPTGRWSKRGTAAVVRDYLDD